MRRAAADPRYLGVTMPELAILFAAAVLASVLFSLIATRLAPTDRNRD